MSDRFLPSKQHPGSSRQHALISRTVPYLQPSLGKGIGIVIVLAFSSGVVLLANDVPWLPFTPLAHAPVSAVPLLLIGLAALGFQFVIRPSLLDLFKAMIVSLAFLLWGIDQLLPAGWLATTVGDLVIVLYVIDLGWMMVDRLKQQGQSRHASQDTAVLSSLVPDPLDGPTQPLHILPLSPSRRPQMIRHGEQPSSRPLVPEQTRHPSSPLKRYRLLALPKAPQEHQPSDPSVFGSDRRTRERKTDMKRSKGVNPTTKLVNEVSPVRKGGRTTGMHRDVTGGNF
jgi:hypothetical protein